MENFTPVSSLAGGILIGLSATATLALLGARRRDQWDCRRHADR
jgi:hypothetical protein